MKIECPHCDQRIALDDDAPTIFECPTCSGQIKLRVYASNQREPEDYAMREYEVDESDSQPLDEGSKSSPKSVIWVIVGVLVIVMGGTLLGSLWRSNGGDSDSHGGLNIESDAGPLESGKSYRLSVVEVDVHERRADGRSWDSLNESAPDLYYAFEMKGVRLYRSSTQKDRVLGVWKAFDAPSLVSLSTKKNNLDEIWQGATMRLYHDSTFVIKVFDNDGLTPDDFIGDCKFDFKKCRVGIVTHPGTGSLKSIKLMVIPLDMDTAEMIEFCRKNNVLY
ncbi:MAG: hypothetical protein H7A51_04195 [Akkermansiaceae bacterium]|nr:hypothetical protein [Akkermansiaceae bacterium]